MIRLLTRCQNAGQFTAVAVSSRFVMIDNTERSLPNTANTVNRVDLRLQILEPPAPCTTAPFSVPAPKIHLPASQRPIPADWHPEQLGEQSEDERQNYALFNRK